MQIERCPFHPHSIFKKYSCHPESRECMLNSCDECKHHGLTVDDIENREVNEDYSDSDYDANMVRCYQNSGREVMMVISPGDGRG